MSFVSQIFRSSTPKPDILPIVTFSSSKSDLTVRIETARLILKSVNTTDIDAYQELFADKRITRLYAAGQPIAKEITAKRIQDIWMKRQQNHDPYHGLAIYEKKSNRFVGHAILGHGDQPGQAEAAMILHKKMWNKGYGQETANALKHYALETVEKGYLLEGKPLTEICITARVDNPYSLKIAESCGMKRTHSSSRWGSLRHHYSAKIHTYMQGSKKIAICSKDVPVSMRKSESTLAQKTIQKCTQKLSNSYNIFAKATNQIADKMDATTQRLMKKAS